jgi:hypothetical protein
MLEIIALIYLCKKTGETAARKGLPPGRWKFYVVIAWFLAEILGFFLGGMLFGSGNLFGLFLFALACAVGGYLVVKAILDKIPDEMDDEINRLGE